MAIRIVRNEQGNCINFYGSSNPTYWNACLSAEVDSADANSINIINDIITSQTGVTQYEFFRIPYTEFVDVEGNGFADAQETADYITEKANVTGLGGGGTDLTDQSVCFKLDDTSTSIMLDNGHSYGANTIKAVNTGDGLITIQSRLGDIVHFTKLDHTRVCDGDGNAISGGLNDVINYLNELFTVGAFESIVISDPYSTMVADVDGEDTSISYVGYGLDPLGNDVYGSTNSNSQNGLLTDETIDQAGEYFTFDIRVEGTIGFGLVHTQASYDNGHYSGYQPYADPTRFGIDNSAHAGLQFSHWFHQTPNGSWTNYGANTSYSMRSGWSNFNGTAEQADWLAGDPIKVRVGIDENSYITIDTLRDGTTWVAHARTSYPVPQGSEYRLGIKTNDTGARVFNIPKVHLLEPAAPTMYFRVVESPDGIYNYPVFATTEEAEYYDDNNGGTGTYTSIVFPDDPTFTTWHIPTNGYTNNGTEIPTTSTFLSNPVTYTEITTLTNADLVPAAFSDATVNIDELGAVNIQLHPVDASYVTSIVDTDSSGLTIDVNGIHLNGTAPEVTGDNVANPSDTYTIEVVRTNSYGSSSGTLTLVISNLTAPSTALSGFTWDNTSAALVDSTTMGEGSVVAFDDTLEEGKRLVIDKAWVETNIYPNLVDINDQVIIGVPKSNADWTSVDYSDFEISIVWIRQSSTIIENYLKVPSSNTNNGIGIGSLTDALYDFAFEVDNGTTYAIASSTSDMNTEPSPSDGGSFTRIVPKASFAGPHTIVIATISAETTLSTSGIGEITAPVASNALTPWSKAIDFSGGSEYLKQVASSNIYNNALRMSSLGVTVAANSDNTKTSSSSSARPWATTIVFQTPNNNTNQHIWNSGEGAGSGDDNMYLRITGSNGACYFGWGREGVGYNEYLVGHFGGSYNQSSGQWWGVYIAHDGTRLNSSDATAANLINAFDIRIMATNDNPAFGGLYNIGNDVSRWTSTGVRMDRTISGDFTIGGRGSNRSFHGKVASMVITTLKTNDTMPSDAEIELMITDPKKWEDDYRNGNTVRSPHSTSVVTYSPTSITAGYGTTQIWLMGDGSLDAYSQGIRNEVYPSEQNYGKIQFQSMVSNDIENVSINGLT